MTQKLGKIKSYHFIYIILLWYKSIYILVIELYEGIANLMYDTVVVAGCPAYVITMNQICKC